MGAEVTTASGATAGSFAAWQVLATAEWRQRPTEIVHAAAPP